MEDDSIYVVDTSVVIEKAISKFIKEGKIKGKILIPRAVAAELENQANKGMEIGFLGLEELQELQQLKSAEIEVEFVGDRPNLGQIIHAKRGGEVDSLIKDIAYSEGATLITADKVQAESAKAFGIEVMFIELKITKAKLDIETFFDDTTMSVHLKEDCIPMGKKGKPGEWSLQKVGNEPLNGKRVSEIAKEVVENSRIDPKAFIEISRRGSTIVQYHNYRIVIVKPPVSDGWEITAVKPIKKLDLNYYNLPKEIEERVKAAAKGILVAGETGSGKSTFSQALAEYYNSVGGIVKTVESPRDLVLSEGITQYSKSFTSSEEMHDILFLSRPDYIIFDEIRDTPDFKLYVDLRLAGSNCLGVIHSASPINAVQRFISRIDTGMIPSVVDTVLFIDKGDVKKVLTLEMVVKVPEGMTEADLARPVVVVKDFVNNKAEFEIYSYGEQTVVVPVSQAKKQVSGVNELAAKQIKRELSHYSDDIKVEFVDHNNIKVYMPENKIARIIGKQGKNIEELEKRLGVHIDVQELLPEKGGESLDYDVKETKKFVVFYVDKPNLLIDVFVDGGFLFSATSSKKGEIRVNIRSKLGKAVTKAMDSKKKIELRVG